MINIASEKFLKFYQYFVSVFLKRGFIFKESESGLLHIILIGSWWEVS